MRKRKVFRETVITVIVIAFEEKTMVCELGNYGFSFSKLRVRIINGIWKLGLLKIGAYHTLIFGGSLKKPYLCIVKKLIINPLKN